MANQRITKGSILEVNIDNEYYIYAQILGKSEYVFFDFKSENRLTDFSILLEVDILFFLAIYDYVVNQGKWLKVGKLPIRDEFNVLPMNFIQDKLNPNNFELYNPNTGEITTATREQCEGLESAAVWAGNHVEDRIRDYYLGIPNIWVELLKIK